MQQMTDYYRDRLVQMDAVDGSIHGYHAPCGLQGSKSKLDGMTDYYRQRYAEMREKEEADARFRQQLEMQRRDRALEQERSRIEREEMDRLDRISLEKYRIECRERLILEYEERDRVRAEEMRWQDQMRREQQEYDHYRRQLKEQRLVQNGESTTFSTYPQSYGSDGMVVDGKFRTWAEIDEYKRRKEERSKMSPKLRAQVMARDHYRCVKCGRSAKNGIVLHVDHIQPISRGGDTVMDNLQTLCQDCNLGKHNSTEEELARGDS